MQFPRESAFTDQDLFQVEVFWKGRELNSLQKDFQEQKIRDRSEFTKCKSGECFAIKLSN